MISVIVPFYNPGKKILNILKSLANQTYGDYEVILIDDGSSDESVDICKKYVSIDQRYKYIWQSNSGVSSARNKGIKLSKGDYITFLDADDKIDENYLEALIDAIKDADISICSLVVCTNDGKIINKFNYKNKYISSTDAINLLLSREYINSGPCCKLFKKDIIKEITFPGLSHYEDIIFVTKCFNKALRLRFTNQTSYYYIQYDDSAMGKLSKNPSLDIVIASEWILDFIQKKRYLKNKCFYITLSHLYQYVASARDIGNKKFIKNVQKVFRKNMMHLIRNSYFSYKEKILYFLFSLGYLYKGKNKG